MKNPKFKWTSPLNIVVRESENELKIMFGISEHEINDKFCECFKENRKIFKENPQKYFEIENLQIYIK